MRSALDLADSVSAQSLFPLGAFLPFGFCHVAPKTTFLVDKVPRLFLSIVPS